DLGVHATMSAEDKLYLMTHAGNIAWRELGDAARARTYFAVVKQQQPDQEDLRAFVREHGDVAQSAEQDEDEDLDISIGGGEHTAQFPVDGEATQAIDLSALEAHSPVPTPATSMSSAPVRVEVPKVASGPVPIMTRPAGSGPVARPVSGPASGPTSAR